jgi:hypothetical protein
MLRLQLVAADTSRTQHQPTEEGAIMLLASSSVPGIILVVALYFVPTIVAVVRKVTNQGSVAVINLFLGWTIIGWIVSLAMACRTSTLVRESVNSPPK